MCITGGFAGLVILSLSRSGIIGSAQIDKSEEKKEVTNYQYNMGVLAISCTAICASAVGVFTRRMKGIHFSII